MNIACRAAVGLVVFLPAAVPLPAEAQSVQITGVVVDATGGVLPGASVTLRGFGAATVEGVAVAGDLVELPAITLRLAAFDDAVVVTATRIEEPLQQVPLSISAVTGADIERRAVGNLTELSALFAYHLQDQQVGARQINHVRSFDTGRYVAGLTPFSSEAITLNGGGAALELLYGYTYIGDVLAPRRVGARIRYTFG